MNVLFLVTDSPLPDDSGEAVPPEVPVDVEGEPRGQHLAGDLPWWGALGSRWTATAALPLEPQVDCGSAP